MPSQRRLAAAAAAGAFPRSSLFAVSVPCAVFGLWWTQTHPLVGAAEWARAAWRAPGAVAEAVRHGGGFLLHQVLWPAVISAVVLGALRWWRSRIARLPGRTAVPFRRLPDQGRDDVVAGAVAAAAAGATVAWLVRDAVPSPGYAGAYLGTVETFACAVLTAVGVLGLVAGIASDLRFKARLLAALSLDAAEARREARAQGAAGSGWGRWRKLIDPMR